MLLWALSMLVFIFHTTGRFIFHTTGSMDVMHIVEVAAFKGQNLRLFTIIVCHLLEPFRHLENRRYYNYVAHLGVTKFLLLLLCNL